MSPLRRMRKFAGLFAFLFLVVVAISCGDSNDLTQVAPADIRLRAPVTVVLPNAGPGGINKETEKWGFIDGTGKMVIPATWENVDDFHEGLARVRKDGKESFIDTSGKVVFAVHGEPAMHDISGNFFGNEYFSEGLLQAKESGKWGFLDKGGNVAIPFQWDFAWSFRDGFASVEQGNKWGLIDKTGNLVVEPQYSRGFEFRDGYAVVEKDGKKGIIDKAGKTISEPQWEWVGTLSDGLIHVAKGGYFTDPMGRGNPKDYFLDATGKIVLDPPYAQASDFTEGLSGVQPKANGKWGFMDKSGKIVIQPQWERVGAFSGGLAMVEVDAKHIGFINRKGEMVIPATLWGAWDFNGDVAWAQVSTGHGTAEGLIDRTGKFVVKPEWDSLDRDQGYWFAKRLPDPLQHELYAWFNKSGKPVWQSDP